MDVYDKAILSALIEDSSLPITQIAKRVRLSRENVQYRIDKLVNQKYINNFITIVDHTRLGFEQFTVAVELAKTGFEQEERFIDAIVKHQNFSWVGPSIGRWSVCFDAFVRDREELEKIFQSFLQAHEQSVAAYQILPTKTLHTWFWKRVAAEPASRKVKRKPLTLDDTDRALLRILSDNSRASYAELAEETRLSANACKYRIKQLEDAGVILQYTVNLNHDTFGFEFCTVRLAAASPDHIIAEKLLKYTSSHPHVWFFYEYYRSGSIDFDIGFIFKDTKELREDLANLRKAVGGDVRIEDVFLPVEQRSAHNLPPAVFVEGTPLRRSTRVQK